MKRDIWKRWGEGGIAYIYIIYYILYIYRERGREREREGKREGKKERETERETDRHRVLATKEMVPYKNIQI